MERKQTRQIHIGPVAVGGGAPVSVQSMTNTKTADVAATVAQIRALSAAGCDIVRLAVPDMDAAKALGEIIRGTDVPLVADIHFDYRLALEAIRQGVAALRLNPGNIGGEERVKAVVREAKAAGIPIRIGVNGGSLDKKLLQKYGRVTAEALVESAMEHVRILEAQDFYDMKISLKAHDVPLTIAAYRLMSRTVDYPLHLGVTEAGTPTTGMIKSAVGYGPTMISCPTCGRTAIDLPAIAAEVEKRLGEIKEPITVAVMGCVVNGPGEAREADVGIAGGKGEGLVFRKGEILRKVPETELVSELFKEIDTLLVEKTAGA